MACSKCRARWGSWLGGGPERWRLGTGQDVSQGLPRTSVSLDNGFGQWVVIETSTRPLLFLQVSLKVAPGQVRISLDCASGVSPFITCPLSALFAAYLKLSSLKLYPLFILWSPCRFSWHLSYIRGASATPPRKAMTLGSGNQYYTPHPRAFLSFHCLKGTHIVIQVPIQECFNPTHSGFTSDLGTDPFRDLSCPRLSGILPTNHSLICDGQRPLENPVGNAI